ncbi:hypothetical protein SEA_SORORFAGO_88 [Mycobacterium phage SororFago]|nr:hypothetical protein SEA_SORORFAGO_88 [Mycobacterium phage SororFago]
MAATWCDTNGHDLSLTEEGYVRTWSTEVDPEKKTIRAYWGGSEDFSDEGSGEYLQCITCGVKQDVPEGWEIDYR